MVDTYSWCERDIRRLLAHIMLVAIEDHSQPKHNESAQTFFDSPELEWVADALGLTTWQIRRRAAEGFDPNDVKEWTRYLRRAHKGKNGGVFAARAQAVSSAKT